jgi:hypothetical protein
VVVGGTKGGIVTGDGDYGGHYAQEGANTDASATGSNVGLKDAE